MQTVSAILHCPDKIIFSGIGLAVALFILWGLAFFLFIYVNMIGWGRGILTMLIFLKMVVVFGVVAIKSHFVG